VSSKQDFLGKFEIIVVGLDQQENSLVKVRELMSVSRSDELKNFASHAELKINQRQFLSFRNRAKTLNAHQASLFIIFIVRQYMDNGV
jgi:hypothetical protein